MARIPTTHPDSLLADQLLQRVVDLMENGSIDEADYSAVDPICNPGEMVPEGNNTGKDFLEAILLVMAENGVGSGQTVSGASGFVFVTDVSSPDGVVSNKVWEDSGNTVLKSCTSSAAWITISLRSSHPEVLVNGVQSTLVLTSGGLYVGTVDVTTTGGTIEVEIDVTGGAVASVDVTLDLPPQILSLSFAGEYPGFQTELKAGDTFQITGTTDKPCTGIQVSDYGAGAVQTISFDSTTNFSVSITIANRTAGVYAARVAAKSASGAYGATRDTNQGGGSTDKVNTVKLNNTFPSISFGTPSYPAGQGALKNSETATVGCTLGNWSSASGDTVAFTSPNSDISIANPNTNEATKTVTRTAGSYNVTTNNLRCTATKASNGAVTVVDTLVKIANVAATVAVTTPYSRLRSGGNNGTSAQNYTITVTASQQLYEAPTLDPASGAGTFTGSWGGTGTTWTRTLQVHDNNSKGTFAWQNPSFKNLSGIVTSAVGTNPNYVLGGFVSRNLTFGVFSQITSLNVVVTDYSKLSAGIFTATNQQSTRMAVQGDHANSANRFTVDSPLSTSPVTLWWNDVNAANSNSGGTAQLLAVQESV